MLKKPFFYLLFALFLPLSGWSQLWYIDSIANMPEPIANNAVTGYDENGYTHLYTFCGIDSTKSSSGIHLRGYHYSTQTGQWDTLPPVPDTLGKVAASASYVDGIIYVIGGYHVFPDGSELSSNRVHRLDVATNTWLSDGAPIPVPIDDQVQAVYQDSLIYVVTGWSNTANVNNVQIYDPANDLWLVGSPLMNDNVFRSFGANGVIIDSVLYYFGGARFGSNFPVQQQLRKGVIDPNDPTQITWSLEHSDPNFVGYRMAAFTYPVYLSNEYRPGWIGGSAVTYNYNGIAYNGSGGVEPHNEIFMYHPANNEWDTNAVWIGDQSHVLPMDLRGAVQPNPWDPAYLMGGMDSNQRVTSAVVRANFHIQGIFQPGQTLTNDLRVYPQPTQDHFQLRLTNQLSQKWISGVLLRDAQGRPVRQYTQFDRMPVNGLAPGWYLVEVHIDGNSYSTPLLIR